VPKTSDSDVARLRRDEIVEAAIAVIAEQGLQHLSLSEIEQRAGMSRGQLTYYFPAKEEILLAVFDRLLAMMHRRAQGEGGKGCLHAAPPGWDHIRALMTMLVLEPPVAPAFHALQYTFLSQISHREDFRQRLADLYEVWRKGLAADVEVEMGGRNGATPASARTVATLIQAILHGLAMQRNADPDSYDREEILALCLDLLESYLRPRPTATSPARRPSRKIRGKHE
jgi:AcrR family transcriptional regulator